jgi:hypothetical protein
MYAQGLLQNSSPDKIPKKLKEINHSCTWPTTYCIPEHGFYV